ncbi:hypothetical protein HAHE_04740 [Haloferula helveola]|uniref:Ice-binding protein C-terminal domain-containing protein n=1 Tax=Haloferula helveola TaxID=490095 RepID=A0ABM7R8P6_9BACT|nr:hypothetical protein HAHE_04740 [Haloferula helveola]
MTTGTLVEAFNGVSSNQTPASFDTTVNGVTFLGNNTLFSETGSGTNNTSDLSAGTNAGDATYDLLLSNVEFGGPASQTISVGNGNLVIGNQYLIQVWFVDDRAAQDSRVMLFGDGNGSNVLLNDQYAVGTFTADATSQDLLTEAQGFGRAHLTAYQIRAIPEPSSLLMLSLAGVLFFRRRH